MKSFLLNDTESVTPFYPKGEAVDTVYPVYYVTAKFKTNKDFICLIYEMQYNIGSGNPNAEKYVCTLTKTGKLIDKLLVASANYSGTGILTESFRVPWFPDVQSKISKDLTIITTESGDVKGWYQLNTKGEFIKKKANQ
jgi:hypothetical protein